MPKNTFDDWSANAADNTDIGGISIVGGAPVSNFDDALRSTMAQLKSGALSRAAGSVGTSNLADSSVTTAKLGPLATTTAKIADLAVTTEKQANGGTTNAKLADVPTSTLKGRVSAGNGAVTDLTVAQVRTLLGIVAPVVLQTRYVDSAVATSTTSIIPFDSTTPQSNEGLQVLSDSITPGSTTSRIRATVTVFVCANAGSNIAATLALFSTNGGTNALRSTASYLVASYYDTLTFVHEWVPGTTAQQTVSIRAGPSSGTLFINRTDAAPNLFTGVLKSSLTLEEVV